MSAANIDMGCDLPGVTCSAGGGSWWLFGLGLAVLVLILARAVRRGRSCPVGDLVGDRHALGRGGRFVRWDVAGDHRRRVRVCDKCARGGAR